VIKQIKFFNKLGIGILLSVIMLKPVFAANDAFFGLDPNYVNKQIDNYAIQSQQQRQQQQQEQQQKSANNKGKKQGGQTTPPPSQETDNTNQTGESSNSGNTMPAPTPTTPPSQTPATGGEQGYIRGY